MVMSSRMSLPVDRMYDEEHNKFMHRLAELPIDDYRSRWELTTQVTDYRNPHRSTLLMGYRIRRDLIKQYAFAIPCEEALRALRALGPIVEMGAGSGYWAYLLRKRGCDVQAYDKRPSLHENEYAFTKQWTGVIKGRPGKLKKRADRALFLCWPSYATAFASTCLARYTGDTVAYIGEGWGGCTGDDAFHEALNEYWSEVRKVDLPQWDGVHDDLYIYRRK